MEGGAQNVIAKIHKNEQTLKYSELIEKEARINTLMTRYFRFLNKNLRLRAYLLNTELFNKIILFRNFYIPNGYSH